MLLPTIEQMKAHAFEPLIPDFHLKMVPGDIVVAGENFGCGSSREQAPAVLKAIGLGCIVAKSFARIFFRNAINIGLPVAISDCYDSVTTGDTITVDLADGKIRIPGNLAEIPMQPLPDHIRRMIEAGGLIEYLNQRANESTLRAERD
jgi:3-isopropylmalate/(R)-2-methylmalate dehydratase small subunit